MGTGRALGTIWHQTEQKLSCENGSCFICEALGRGQGTPVQLGSAHVSSWGWGGMHPIPESVQIPTSSEKAWQTGKHSLFFFSPIFFLIVGFGGGIWSALEYSPFSPVHRQSEMLPATFSPLISPNLILFLHGGGNFRCQEESSRSIYVISRRKCQSSSPSLLFSW